MLTQFFESAKTFVSTLTTDQLVAIFIAVLAISCAVKLIKTGLSVILSKDHIVKRNTQAARNLNHGVQRHSAVAAFDICIIFFCLTDPFRHSLPGEAQPFPAAADAGSGCGLIVQLFSLIHALASFLSVIYRPDCRKRRCSHNQRHHREENICLVSRLGGCGLRRRAGASGAASGTAA